MKIGPVLLVALGTLATLAAQAEHKATIAEQQARQWADFAAKKANGDPAVFEKTFGDLVRIQAQGFQDGFSGIVSAIPTNDDLYVLVAGPVTQFGQDVSVRVRKMDPISGALFPKGVVVDVDPQSIQSPNIEKVVLKRDGAIVEPIESTLAPRELVTRMGVKRMLGQGQVTFPISAFAPGAEVTLTLVPEVGQNIVKVFDVFELRKLI